MEGGVLVDELDAPVRVQVEVRDGTDPVPAICYEFTDVGTRVVVDQ